MVWEGQKVSKVYNNILTFRDNCYPVGVSCHLRTQTFGMKQSICIQMQWSFLPLEAKPNSCHQVVPFNKYLGIHSNPKKSPDWGPLWWWERQRGWQQRPWWGRPRPRSWWRSCSSAPETSELLQVQAVLHWGVARIPPSPSLKQMRLYSNRSKVFRNKTNVWLAVGCSC